MRGGQHAPHRQQLVERRLRHSMCKRSCGRPPAGFCSWSSSSRSHRQSSRRPSHEYTAVNGASTRIPKREHNQLSFLAVVYACFSAAVFLAQPSPSRSKGYSARPFSFLSPEAPQTFHPPLSSDTPSCALTTFLYLNTILLYRLFLFLENIAICSAGPWTAARHGVQQ